MNPNHTIPNNYPVLPVGMVSDLQRRVYAGDQGATSLAQAQANLVSVCHFPGSIYGGEPVWGRGGGLT